MITVKMCLKTGEKFKYDMARIFLLVDLGEIFSQIKGQGGQKKKL